MRCERCGYEGTEPEAFTWDGELCMSCVGDLLEAEKRLLAECEGLKSMLKDVRHVCSEYVGPGAFVYLEPAAGVVRQAIERAVKRALQEREDGTA